MLIQSSVGEAALSGRTIYVVDDDAGVRKSTSYLLRSLGYVHRPYVNGGDFLDEIASLKPGCVLLDIRMPGVSGLEVIARIAPFRGRFPTIVMTGHGDIETAVRAMKMGAVDFLEKPFSEEVLLAAVDNCFELVRKYEQWADRSLDQAAVAKALTRRQMDVLGGVVEGLSNKAIAQKLEIAPRTVEMHRANLMAKLGVNSLAKLLNLALSLDLNSLPARGRVH